MKNLYNPKAQSTVEYLIIASIVISGIIVVAMDPNGAFQQNYLDILKERAITMQESTIEISGSNGVELILPTCGNGTLEPGEVCENGNLNGETCVTQGYSLGGTLSCTNCRFNTVTCIYCGNGILQATEECDGSARRSGMANCFQLGFPRGGLLQCSSSCTLDTSGCLP